jgi:FdrA protein
VPNRSLIRKSEYHDSVTLMLVARELLNLPGVLDAAVVMGTEANKGILAEADLLTVEAQAASPNDLVITVRAENDKSAEAALAKAEELLAQKRAVATEGEEYQPRSIDTAVRTEPEVNLAVISVAGRYAAGEARKALQKGLHVFLFSDNVPLEDEIELKRYAQEEGLLLMGPDAGTAIINGVALGFANAVPEGNIGLVAASGTGLQEVTSLIARQGGGVSQAVGVGGRDLSEAVGGIMMMESLMALQEDPDTQVLVLISKPPAPGVAEKVLGLVRASDKPTVVCFLGGDPSAVEAAGAVPATTLEEAAFLAGRLAAGGQQPVGQVIAEIKRGLERRDEELEGLATEARSKLTEEQRYVRGLFCGGTFCYEAMLILRDIIGDVHSNAPLEKRLKLADSNKSLAHTCVDLGEDEFTLGRLHPMLDLSLRNRRIQWEAEDPETVVILLDVVLGYGVHPDPAGETAEAIRVCCDVTPNPPIFVAHVCGTEGDPQSLAEQEEKLKEAGVLVVGSNAAAARLVGMIARAAPAPG